MSKKITALDVPTMKTLRPEIERELEALGKRLGIKLSVGSGSCSPSEATFKLKILVDDQTVQANAAKKTWDIWCALISGDPREPGLRPEDLGTEFTYAGLNLRTIGLLPRKPKYPIQCETIGGPKAGQVRILPIEAIPFIRKATDMKAVA